jgi:FPC/CPF motif-containing protein YcgG
MAEPKQLPKSSLEYVLRGLIPYTDANLKLTFRPYLFFRDLDKIAYAKKRSLQNAYYKALRDGLIEMDDENVPRLTKKGWRKVRPYSPKELGKNARLMVIFDIPEQEAWKRKHLWRLLRELKFQQIQKSVWASPYDHRELLAAEVKQYGLEEYVQVYEALRV